MEKNQIWAKGSGSTGCLMNNTLQDQKQFVRLPLDFKVKEIALSGSFVVCRDQNSRLFFWGSMNEKIIQKPLLMHNQVVSIKSGWNHFLFTTKEGLWGMGSNSNLELGVQTLSKYVIEPLFLKEGKIQTFSCGFRQSYAIIGNSLWGCGETKKFELGLSQKSSKKWMVLFSEIQKIAGKIKVMCCGKRFLLMLTEDCKVLAFGNNEQNVFNNILTHTIVPTVIFQGIQQMAAGWAHIVLLDKHSRILTFGRNNLGQLGRQETESVTIQLQNQQLVTNIVSGTQFSFAVTSLGKIYGWGWNEHMNILTCENSVLPLPKLVQAVGKCKKVWTHCATTIIECQIQQN